jgi:hypothetical protein
LQAFVDLITTEGKSAGKNPFGIPLFDPNDPYSGNGAIVPEGFVQRQELASFMFAFDSNMAPAVGQQVTLTRSNGAVAGPRLALLLARADAKECDLVAKARIIGIEVGWTRDQGLFVPSVIGPSLTDAQLRLVAQTGASAVTYSCVPPGSGWRIGIDRDGDGWADGDELLAGSNPADANSVPH